MQDRGGADLLAVVVIIGAAQAVQGAGSRRRGLLLYAAGQIGRRWCGLLLAWSSGAALAVLIFPGAGGGRNIRVLCPALPGYFPAFPPGRLPTTPSACRGADPARRAGMKAGRKEKAQGGGAGGARVALGLCRRCWSAADPAGPRRGHFAVCRRGQILHFTG